MLIVAVLMAVPFYITIVRGIAPQSDYAMKSVVLFPSRIDPTYFKIFFSDPHLIIWKAYANTIFITVVGTAINMVLTLITSYCLAEKRLPFRTAITMIFLVPMFIGGGTMPSYIMYSKMHLLNTLWVLIIPGALDINNMLLMRNFIMALPEELIEAATIDGANKMQLIWKIVVPLSMASVATIGLFYAVGHWSTYGSAIYFISPAHPELEVLQVYLNNIMNQGSMDQLAQGFAEGVKPSPEGLKAVAIIATTLPICCVYPFIQKYFVKGIMIGGLKG
jgi:putative aldouronate transport system permease protein